MTNENTKQLNKNTIHEHNQMYIGSHDTNCMQLNQYTYASEAEHLNAHNRNVNKLTAN